MATLLAKNAEVLVTMDGQRRELRGGGLFARDGVIEQVGSTDDLPATADLVLDLRDHVLLPGLVNCHHHLDQVLTRNLPAGQNTNLFPWLRAHYRIWAGRTPEDTRTAVIVGCAELALSGCTTVFDHAYVFQNGCRVDDQIGAAAEVGVRFVVSRGSMSLGESRGGLPPDECVEDEVAIMADSQRVIERYHDPKPGSMLQIVLAPCSPFSVTPELLTQAGELARREGVRLHTHLAETTDEEEFCRERFGATPTEYVESLGWLGDDVWMAHSVHLDDAAVKRFAATGTGVAHCPSSNARLGAGIARVQDLRDAGVAVGLGVDGAASNEAGSLLEEVRHAVLFARARGGPRALAVRDALEMATVGGARVLGRADELGSIEPGKLADLALWRLDTLPHAGIADPVAALALASQPPLELLLVNGRPVVERDRLLTVDEDDVARAAAAATQTLLARAS